MGSDEKIQNFLVYGHMNKSVILVPVECRPKVSANIIQGLVKFEGGYKCFRLG